MGDLVKDPVGAIWDSGQDIELNKFEGNGRTLDIRTLVSPCGGQMDLQITRGDQVGKEWGFSFGEACLIYHELRVATHVAEGRQRMTLNTSIEAIADLFRTALVPTEIGFSIDQATGEIIVCYLFAGHAPFAVRLTAEMICKARKELEALCAKRSN